MKAPEKEMVHELPEPARSLIAPYARQFAEADARAAAARKVLADMLGLACPELVGQAGMQFDTETLSFFRLPEPKEADE